MQKGKQISKKAAKATTKAEPQPKDFVGADGKLKKLMRNNFHSAEAFFAYLDFAADFRYKAEKQSVDRRYSKAKERIQTRRAMQDPRARVEREINRLQQKLAQMGK